MPRALGQLGVIDGRTFAVMVPMALATAIMTAPLLGAIERAFAPAARRVGAQKAT